MSRSLVRSAVYGYINTPQISGVDYVFPGIPFDQAGVAWDSIIPAGQTHRCFLVVIVNESADWEREHVFVFDGAGGRRLVSYPVSLEIYFEDISGDPLAALTVQEQTLDNIAARLRADPSLGQPSTSGIVAAAVPELKVNPGILERQGEGDPFVSWSAIDFSVSVYEFST
ncbi:hypothetical protein [Amycolatopsis pigmentata]|uniref:Uncharacterized protein n=1 Tax=Amycolatopsis pigmentata TaxID=450801 RepID=A0ABW5G403_9PSEU